MLPQVIIFDSEAEGNEGIISWQPRVQEAEGVKGLTQLLIEFREFIRAERKVRGRSLTTLAAINNENLGLLLTLAYRASFRTDEGRSIRARVVVKAESWLPPNSISALALRILADPFIRTHLAEEDQKHHSYRFTEPIPLTDYKPLIKLAPLLIKPDGAITVTEENGTLQVTGLALLDREGRDRGVLDMPSLWSPSSALLIEIVGPGHLRVSEGRASFALHADQFVTHTPFFSVEPVGRWLAEFSRECVNKFKELP
ncbi:hypothetical protein GobsT_65810 [Gemmata obscuriglobus]|nr:hypothetical protein GobsT_65810 [Gemmata obscuriglobus]VTS11083.1 unnamed protein product [Gemmata obscuriglobus UQM 2246]